MSSWAEESEAVEEASAVAGEAELVDDATKEEDHAGEVGFGFGDGYDFGAAAGEALLKPAANEGGSGVAVEADIGEIVSKGGIIGEDEVAGVRVSAVVGSVLGSSAPVPDGEVGTGCP
jgi:hypothetical protein